MRALACLFVLCAATEVAHADLAARDELILAVNRAVVAKDAKTLAALFADRVELEANFDDAKCDKQFGGGRSRTVTGKLRGKLAACIAATGWSGLQRFKGGDPDRAMFWIGHRLFDLGLAADATGALRITKLGLDLGELDGVLADCDCAELTCECIVDEAGTKIGDDPAPPATPPALVKTTVLEQLRTSGTAKLEPDAKVKQALAKAKPNWKGKFVASLKTCVDATGKVSAVTVIKSSSVPAWDAALTAAIKAWTFAPYTVDGAAVPACTAHTFIYAPGT